MGKLARLLEYAHGSSTEKKRILNRPSFKTEVLNTYPKEKRELIISDELESSTLLQEEVFSTIVEGAQPVRCVRDVFPVENIKTNQLRITYQSGAVVYADKVAEGAKIPLHTDKFATKTISVYKIGTRPIITNEMIEDGLWDTIEFELKQAGYKLENKLNRDVIDAAINAPAGVGTAATVAVSDIAKGMQYITKKNRVPTHMIIHPVPESQLISGNNLLQAQMAGDNKALRNYDLGSLFGLKTARLNVTTATTGTYDWGDYTGANDVGVLICDPSFVKIAMRRDITVEKYEDPIHDLQGISATMRFGVGTINSSGSAYIIKHS